jgi:hypothetical protein
MRVQVGLLASANKGKEGCSTTTEIMRRAYQEKLLK